MSIYHNAKVASRYQFQFTMQFTNLPVTQSPGRLIEISNFVLSTSMIKIGLIVYTYFLLQTSSKCLVLLLHNFILTVF